MKQLTHQEVQFNKRTFPITLVLDRIEKIDNIAMLARLCEAFGVSQVIFIDSAEFELSQKLIKKSRHSLDKLKLCFITTEAYQSAYPNVRKVALDITSESKTLDQFITTDLPVHLIIGNERNGISQQLLNICQDSYHIHMYGQNTSLNVATATAIALYAITSQMR